MILTIWRYQRITLDMRQLHFLGFKTAGKRQFIGLGVCTGR